MDATFDTLAYARKLEEAGLDRKLAEVQAEALRQFEDSQNQKARRELATKADLRELELRLENKMQTMEGRIRNWVIGLLLAQTAILGGLISWLVK